MLSKQKIVAAAIALSMMVLPATALAGHHDRRWDGRPTWNYRHDNGKHKGWWKHDHDWDHRADSNRSWYYHHEPDRDDYHPVWNHHHEPDADDYNRGYYHHEPDADDYNYDAMPYGRSVGEQIQYLMQRRATTYALYRQARNRHDSGAQSRLSASIHSIDARIRRLRRTNGYGYAPMAVPYSYAPSSFTGNPYFGNNYVGSPYMGSAYPYNNPGANALGALVGPMLGIRY